MSELIARIANEIYTPVAFLLILGGLFFLIKSRFVQYKYFKHAINILRGKYANPNDPGQINPYEALSTALASTVGMGNIAGVAAAISIGGPGALFWMWMTALVGMSTNFFTSTLSIMYRGKDSEGVIQGGPMYVIREAHWVNAGSHWPYYSAYVVWLDVCRSFRPINSHRRLLISASVQKKLKMLPFSFWALPSAHPNLSSEPPSWCLPVS
jgi:Na+/alanine symporter